MTVFLPILVCLCGGVGASCRYLLDVTIKTYWQRAFPLSTFTINLIAGFLAGLVEMVTLFRKHRYPTAAAYLVLSLGVPVVAAACGFLV